jgi:ribonuclease BN (tRNA processing enzyme)
MYSLLERNLRGNRKEQIKRDICETDCLARPLYRQPSSYICRGPEVKGKFNKAAAVALGIKPGPMYGKLHRGETLTLADGRVITPDQVCDPPIPGHVSDSDIMAEWTME